MKNLFMAAVLFVTLSTFAQQDKSIRKPADKTERLSSEQRQQLRLKEMTLKLDLNASQQKEMSKIIAEQDAKRETAKSEYRSAKEKGVKPTAEEKFARKNQRLDAQIAMQQRLKAILTPEQMKKWDDMKTDKKQHYKHAAKGKRKMTATPKGN